MNTEPRLSKTMWPLLLALSSSLVLPSNLFADERPLIEQWLDGDVDANYTEITYDGPPIRLRFSSFLSPSGGLYEVQKRALDRLEADTGGMIQPEAYWGSSLADGQSGAIDAVNEGLVDYSTCYVQFNPGPHELQLALQMPFIFETSLAGVMAATSVYPEYLNDEYEDTGVYLARLSMTPPQQIFSRRSAIREVGDLRGERTWVVGDLGVQYVNATGASPVPLSLTEMYSAFQTGVVDHVITHNAAGMLFGINEITGSHTTLNLWPQSLELCVNRDFFDDLPEDLQDVFYHWLQLANLADSILYFDRDADISLNELENQGVGFHEPEGDAYSQFVDAVQPVADDFIAELEESGHPANDFVGELRDYAEKYNQLTADEISQQILDEPLPGLIDF